MSQGELEVDEIRRQMAQIRVGLHHDVSGVVDSAERALDWRSYLRNAPWVSVGLGFALGYLIVPRRKQDEPSAPESPADLFRLIRPPERRPEPPAAETRESKEESGGIVPKLFSFVWPVAVRAAQSYAASWIEGLIAGQTEALRGSPPSAPRESEYPAGSAYRAGRSQSTQRPAP
jgi:hypothetical protein